LLLIQLCGRSRQFDRAVAAFEEMKAAGIPASQSTYMAMIRVCGLCKDQKDKAKTYFDAMMKDSLAFPQANFEEIYRDLKTL